MKRKKDAPKKRIILRFDDNNAARDLFGSEDVNLRTIENLLGLEIDSRGNTLLLVGAERAVAIAEEVLSRLYGLLRKGNHLISADVERAVKLLAADKNADIESLFRESASLPTKTRPVMPRSPAQREYIEKINTHDLIFSIGPAGTGKSYLAVATAVSCLLKKKFDRIILARPAVEAGEKLGFLPGDMLEKVNPYLRPLYDALYDMLDRDKVQQFIDEDIIEIAPLAFMRGRTLHRSFIIIDEAQNCSYQQMKMCLTRLGVGSRMVVTGDVTQTDLPEGQRSGLLEALRILKYVEGITFHQFSESDIVRHPLVKGIVSAYEREEANNG